MSRIIMLTPLEKLIGLTTISLSLIHFFNQMKRNSLQSILYLSCKNNILDDTGIIIKNHFSNYVDVLDGIDFSTITFNSNKYFLLIENLIEICDTKKNIYEFIFIEGLSFKQHTYFHNINYDISKSIHAEVIIISTLKYFSFKNIQEKEKNIKYLLEYHGYKNILGIIFNQMNPLLYAEYTFFSKKLNIFKNIFHNKKKWVTTDSLFLKTLYPLIASIPLNINFFKVFAVDICVFFRAQIIHTGNMNHFWIHKLFFFHSSLLYYENNITENTLVILPFVLIDFFIQNFYLQCPEKKISILLFTQKNLSYEYTLAACKIFVDKNISIFLVNSNMIEIINKLQNFNFNIRIKNKNFIIMLQRYIVSFFNKKIFFSMERKRDIFGIFSPQEFCYRLKILSRKSNKRIILPESYEHRILQAVSICYDLNIAQCVLLGNPEKIYTIAKRKGIHLNENIEIINPDLIREQYITRLVKLRKNKGMNNFLAKEQLKDNTMLATLLLESDIVDGLVSGSVNTTANTIRPALQLIKTNINSSLVSSIFFMLLPDQVLIYGDCAININPTAEELADIAIQSAESAKIFGIEPRIAMLSYSTGNSGSGNQVEKVKLATNIVKIKRPDLIIDGPIQYDAASSLTVSKLKISNSVLLGAATIFIFPDLNSGNITYKAVQRSAKLVSIGPMLQGLRKPVNDLSRGALIKDIIYTIALTSIQSMK